MADGPMAADGVPIPIRSGGQQWLVSWHPPPEPPDGTPHGAEGVCVTADGDVVVISPDGTIWDLPAGRPEPGESWEQTLRREMDEPRFDRVGELVKIEQHEHALEERAARPRLEPAGKLELVRHRVIRVYSRQRPQQRDRIPVTAAL